MEKIFFTGEEIKKNTDAIVNTPCSQKSPDNGDRYLIMKEESSIYAQINFVHRSLAKKLKEGLLDKDMYNIIVSSIRTEEEEDKYDTLARVRCLLSNLSLKKIDEYYFSTQLRDFFESSILPSLSEKSYADNPEEYLEVAEALSTEEREQRLEELYDLAEEKREEIDTLNDDFAIKTLENELRAIEAEIEDLESFLA